MNAIRIGLKAATAPSLFLKYSVNIQNHGLSRSAAVAAKKGFSQGIRSYSSYDSDDDDAPSKIIHYNIIPEERSDEAADMFLSSFCRDEPMCTALGLPENQVTRWIKPYIKHVVKQNVSWMATDGKSKKIIGTSFNVRVSNKESPECTFMDFVDPKTEPIAYQLAKFVQALNKGVNVQSNADAMLQLLRISVMPKYTGKGVGPILLMKAEEYALRTKGFTTFYAYTTSEYNYRVLKKIGFQTLREVKHADYKDPDSGANIFAKADMGVHQVARALYKVRTL